MSLMPFVNRPGEHQHGLGEGGDLDLMPMEELRLRNFVKLAERDLLDLDPKDPGYSRAAIKETLDLVLQAHSGEDPK